MSYEEIVDPKNLAEEFVDENDLISNSDVDVATSKFSEDTANMVWENCQHIINFDLLNENGDNATR